MRSKEGTQKVTGESNTAQPTAEALEDMPTVAMPQSKPRTANTPPAPPFVPPPTFFDGSWTDPDGNPQSAQGKARIRSYRPSDRPQIVHWRYVFNAALIMLDIAMMLLACVVSMILQPGIGNTIEGEFERHGSLIVPLIFAGMWVVSLWTAQSYRIHTMGEGYTLYTKILNAALIFFVALCTIGYLFGVDFPRLFSVLATVFGWLFTMVERWLMRRLLHKNRMKGENSYPTVIIGSPAGIRRAINNLTTTPGNAMGYRPVAVCPITSITLEADPDAPQHLAPVPFEPLDETEAALKVLPLNSRMPQMAKKLGANAVLVTDVMTRDSETLRTLSLAVESMGIELAIAASVADIGGGRMQLRNNSAMPILTASLPQYSWPTRFVKRTIDIAFSCLALIVAAIPLAIVAVLVKMEDGGPVIYQQNRIGQYGVPFKVYKIRSMRVDADKMDVALAQQEGKEHGILFKSKDDPRITKIGRFIRKTSIDELPQFVNVLKGDMSIVGPRPQQQYEVDQYGTLYSSRLLVKPGITGPWQISGRSDLSQEEAEYLDVSYVENWSVTTDIAIMLKTAGAIVHGSGAY